MTNEQIKKSIKRCREDILFLVNKFIIEPYNKETGENFFITKQQNESLLKVQELVRGKRNGEYQDILGVSIMAGKGNGKDAFSVWVILWFMFCFPNPKVPCISVSSDQLDKVLWSEISKWLSYSMVQPYFVLQTDKLFRKDVKEDKRGKEWMAFKKAANPKKSANEQVETLQGIHADYLLQVVDEGSGILEPVFSALENNQTGKCNFMLIVFNPMHSKGYAIDTQYKNSHRWFNLRWNSEESEIVNQSHVKRIEEDFGGKESNPYRMNVLGLPPLFDESTLINWDWIMEASTRELVILPNMPHVWGVDCGGGGDMSIIAQRKGNKLYPFKRKKTNDSTLLVNWIGHEIDVENPDCVRVDTIGIGWAVEGALREKKGGIVESADVRRQADNPERFANKRAEMFWNLRELFEKGEIEIPNDTEFMNQLSVIKYKSDNKGRTMIMEKSEIKKELGHSPDEADAAAILYYYPDSLTSKVFLNNYEPERYYDTWMGA